MNSYKKTYFYAFNITKIFFIFLVVCYHTSLFDGVINHAYLSVEFFFIVSGFLIARRAANKEKRISSIKRYLKDRLYKLYPHYIFSCIIMLIVSIVIGIDVTKNYNILAEIFLIQALGFTKGGVNYPCWYLSVLVWGSILFYAVLLYTNKKERIFFSAVCTIMFYVWVNMFNGGRTVSWGYFHGFYIPLFRGLANIALGVILYELHIYIKRFFRRGNWIIEVISFVLAMIFMAMPSNYDTLFVFFICIFILSILWENSIFNHIGKNLLVRKISKYEYAFFLNHAVIIMLLERYILNTYEFRIMFRLLILLLIVLIYSIITQNLLDFVKNKIVSLFLTKYINNKE